MTNFLFQFLTDACERSSELIAKYLSVVDGLEEDRGEADGVGAGARTSLPVSPLGE